MCQSIAQGGRRCAQHQAGSLAAKEMSRLDSALHKGQVDHLFKKLLEEGADRPAPTQAEYAQFIRAHKKKLNAVVFQGRSTDAQRERIGRHLDKELSDSELPSGAAFYAMKKLHARSREQKLEFTTQAKAVARELGVTLKRVREQFNAAYNDFTVEGEVENGSNFLDDKTVAVLAAIRSEALNSEAATAPVSRYSSEPRVVHQTIHGSSFLNSAGWDEDDGRLEVNIRGQIYAYRNVPRELYDRLMVQAGRVFSSEIRNNPAYQYESREAAERDAFGRFCDDCHRYRAISGHICDYSAAEGRARESLEALSEISLDELNEQQRRKVEEAYERIKESLDGAEVEQPPSIEEDRVIYERTAAHKSAVPTLRKSARQRRWEVPVEDRETVEVSPAGSLSYFFPRSDGSYLKRGSRRGYFHHTALSSSVADLKRTIYADGKVAQHKLTTFAYWDSQKVVAEADSWMDADGKVQHKVRSLKCDCEQYREKYYCPHVLGIASGSGFHLRTFSNDELERLGVDPSSVESLVPGSRQGSYLLRNMELNNLPQELVDYTVQKNLEEITDIPLDGLSHYINPAQTRLNGEYGAIQSRNDLRREHHILTPSGLVGRTFTPNFRQSLIASLNNGEKARLSLPVRRPSEHLSLSDGYITEYTFTADVSVVDGEFQVDLVSRPPYLSNPDEAERLKAFVTQIIAEDGQVARGSNPDEVESVMRSDEWAQAVQTTNTLSENQRARSSWEHTLAERERTRALFEEATADYERRRNTAEGYTVTVEDAGRQGFTNNIDGYIDAVRAARRDSGGIPFQAEGGVTNGLCTPESGIGFGLELEFDLPDDLSRSDVGRLIAMDMERAGLSDIGYQTGYHGYRGNRWHIERDSSVAGEVVSPILYDTPESWEEVRKVTEIIKARGGRVSVRTGGHVHMGLPGGEGTKPAVAQTVARYHDSIRRAQTSLVRGQHRNTSYAAPIPANTLGYVDSSVSRTGRFQGGSNHFTDTNFGHSGRMEFRGFDASLDVAELQKNVAVSAGIVRLAEANREKAGRGSEYYQETHSEVGSNLSRMSAIGASSGLPDSDDELIVGDRDFRDFIDTILPGEWGRKAGAVIAARVPWQRAA